MVNLYKCPFTEWICRGLQF
uniref:Uncharacterized protein n=1 Tax=Rhizophora mucronata TaxID=61149 RepID=A0A2P2QRF3_RHIMU